MICLNDQLRSGVAEWPERGRDCGDLVGREVDI
jgi:hypothetical protein